MGMALLKRLLHSAPAGSASADADWWYLVFETDTRHFRVVHEWGNADHHRHGKITGGTVELDVTAYLSRQADPGQRELVRLIQTMFEAAARNAAV